MRKQPIPVKPFILGRVLWFFLILILDLGCSGRIGYKAEDIKGFNEKKVKKSVTYFGICFFVAIFSLSSTTGKAGARDFPEHDITYIVSYAVGGKADLMARAIAPFVQERLGVGLKIENVPGVVRIGLTRLWKSKPDGYTMGGFSLPAPMITELTSQTDYRTLEFTPLFGWNASNAVLQVHKDGPQTMKEFLQSAKSKTLTCAIGAYGTGAHLVGILMARGLGIDLRWVHYNSGGEASTALAGAHVDCSVVAVTPQTISLVRGGKLRSLLVVADERDPAFPDTPVPKDLGYSFTAMCFIEGVVAPKNLPPDQARRVENAFSEAVKDPRFLKWADDTKTQIIPFPAKAFGQKINQYYHEVDKYKTYLK